MLYSFYLYKRKGSKTMNELIQNYQARQNAKFKKMVENSTVIKTETVPVKKLHLISDDKRKRSLIILILTIAYSVISKIILLDFSLDFLVLLNVVAFATDFYLRVNDNSVWALNHYSKISSINMLNKIATTLIFFWTTGMHITELLEIIKENQYLFDEIMMFAYTPSEGRWECFKIIFEERPMFIISFAYSIIMFIPILFFFIRYQIKYYSKNFLAVLSLLVPILGLVVIYKWIMAFRDFKEYVLIDEHTCRINHRRLNNSSQVASKAVMRAGIIIAVIVLYVIIMYQIQGL